MTLRLGEPISLSVPSPIGFPAVFYKEGFWHGAMLHSFAVESGFTDGYSWTYPPAESDDQASGWDALDQDTRVIIIGLVCVSLFACVALFMWRVYGSCESGPGGETRLAGQKAKEEEDTESGDIDAHSRLIS